jgi:signal transduction histidine kinase
MVQQPSFRTEIENQALLINDLLKFFLQTHSRMEFMEECLARIKQWAGLSGVGIRVLETAGNIPFQAHVGYSPGFVDSEKWLSTLEDQCLCIRVAQGKTDSHDLSQTTPGGSFCCNDTQVFLAGLNEVEKKRYRGACINFGYASLAVIPIIYQNQTLGILHLVDSRAGVFSPSLIAFLESALASLLGEGIYRFSIEDQLKQNLDIQTVLTSLLKHSLENLSLDGILNLALDLIHSYKPLSTERKSAIFLTDNDSGKLKLLVSFNLDEIELARCERFIPGEKDPSSMLLTLAPDPEDARFINHYTLPILFQNTLLGLICIFPGRGHRRDEKEEVFLNTVANTLAGIIWRKRTEYMLRQLSLRMVSLQEEERRKIALELHDQVGQMLTGLNLMIGQTLRSNTLSNQENLQEAQNVVTDLIIKVREMSLNLRPSMLDDLGLLPTLIWHFKRCQTQSNLEVDFRHSGLDVTLPQDLAIAAYRIVQEALTNVMRYAGVNSVLVEIWTDQDWLHIRIEDKGQGFKVEELTTGSSLGLHSMRERALLLGGKLSVESVPRQGTRVFAQLPLKINPENVTIAVNQVLQ